MRIIVILVCLHGIQSVFPKPYPHGEHYQHVDTYVADLNENQFTNLLQLTKKLTHPFNKQREKVRAIFRWITANIEYDIQAMKRRENGLLDPEAILKKRKCVCGGYATLFKEMVNMAGMEAEIVTGYSKGYGYTFGNIFSEGNRHAWNAVKIDGNWFLIDATWGAGYVDENEQFRRSFNEFYFFPDPGALIQTHFPQKTRWQLLDNKVTRTEFENFVYLHHSFFEYGLTIKSHPEYRLNTRDSVTILLSVPDNIRLIAGLHFGTNELDEMYTFCQRKGTDFEINVVFPETAVYTLNIYARDTVTSNSNMHRMVMSHQIDATISERRAVGFPKVYQAFIDHDGYLFTPKSQFLEPGQGVRFKIRLPDAEEVILISAEDIITKFQKTGDIFTGHFTVPKGDMFLASRVPGTNRYEYLLKFSGWKSKN